MSWFGAGGGETESGGGGGGDSSSDSIGGFFGALTSAALQVGEAVKKNVDAVADVALAKIEDEQRKFVNSKAQGRAAAVPPWVGADDEDQLREQILLLSADKRNFTRDPPRGQGVFQFDFNQMQPVAMAILAEDNALEKMRFDLVPKIVSEDAFWRNYFYRVSLISQSAAGAAGDAAVGASAAAAPTSAPDATAAADDDDDDDDADDANDADIVDSAFASEEVGYGGAEPPAGAVDLAALGLDGAAPAPSAGEAEPEPEPPALAPGSGLGSGEPAGAAEGPGSAAGEPAAPREDEPAEGANGGAAETEPAAGLDELGDGADPGDEPGDGDDDPDWEKELEAELDGMDLDGADDDGDGELPTEEWEEMASEMLGEQAA